MLLLSMTFASADPQQRPGYEQQQRKLQQEQEQAEPIISTEDLFDMLEVINGEVKEEKFPPLQQVANYKVSWSAFLSFSRNSTTTSSGVSVEDLMTDQKSRYKLQLHLACPYASYMVVGLVDMQGKWQQSNINEKNKDFFTCNHPSRNSLACHGIASKDILSRVNDISNSSGKHQYNYNLVFETAMEVTCLAYQNNQTDIGTTTTVTSKIASPVNNNTSTLGNHSDLGLVISTPKQQLKSQSISMILTESLHAARITNLANYLQPPQPRYSSSSNSEDEDEDDDDRFDSSSFLCSTTTPKTSSTECSSTQDNANTKPSTRAPGFCSRHVTCYYSAPSNDASCSAMVQPMVLSSLDLDDRSSNNDSPPPTRRKLRTRRQLSPISASSTTPASRVLKDNQRSTGSTTSNWIYEARYRILWTVTSMACESYPMLVDITCPKADTTVFRGSSSFSAAGGSHNNTPTAINTYRHAVANDMECHSSLLDDNLLHCRRSIPATTTAPQYYQEDMALDISCITRIDDPSEMVSNEVRLTVSETSNIPCQHTATSDNNGGGDDNEQLSFTGSAFVVVPVSIKDNRRNYYKPSSTEESANKAEQQSMTDDLYMAFPPLNTRGDPVYDPITSHTCSSLCSDNNQKTTMDYYDHFINYNNTIGNKVSQHVRGCQTFASCQTTSGKKVVEYQLSSPNIEISTITGDGGCTNSLSSLLLSFQDSMDTEYASRVYLASSASPGWSRHTTMSSIGCAVMISSWMIWTLVAIL